MSNVDITKRPRKKVGAREVPKLDIRTSIKFWAKVARRRNSKGNCWRWLGSKTSDGYGRFYIEGHRSMFLVHRVMWVESGGKLKGSDCVLHKCDNPSCVNPTHLFVGTLSDNMRDMVEKRRNNPQRGESNGAAKININEVRQIRRMAKDRTITQSRIADMFGITQVTVSGIHKRKIWRHLS